MALRADNNDGSCREILTGRQKGKWRVQYWEDPEIGPKRRLSRVFETKTAAKTFLQEVRRGKRIEAVRRTRELTLSEWFNWLVENDWPETLTNATIGYRKGRFRKYVEKEFGDKPLSRIKPLSVRSFYRELRELGVSDSVILEIRTDMVRAFNQAISPYQQVPMSMANPFRLALPRPAKRIAVALTPEEVKSALKQKALSDSQRAMLGLFLLAGLRLGEVMAIARGQLRLDDSLIIINRAVRVSFGGEQQVELPKGGKTRSVVMCRTLKTLLQAHIEGMSADSLLWPAATENKPRMKKLTYATWRTIVKAAKLPESMTPHDCRLTHINLIEKLMPAVSLTTLKEHVGHAASGVTEANYTRPLSSAQAILRNELDSVLGFSHL